jgi:hypothetical protein
MKKFIIPALAVCLLACEKRSTVTQEPSLLIIQAKAYFTDSVLGKTMPMTYRAAQAKTVIWNDAQISMIGGRQAVVVPITYNQPMMVKANFAGDFYFHLNYLTQLVIYRDSALIMRARVLTYFPDSIYFKNPEGNFTGIQFIEDWQGNTIGKYLYSNDGQVRTFKMSTKESESLISTCYTISGYNYSPDDPDGGYYWSEDAGCDYEYISDAGGLGGTAGIGGSAGGGAGSVGPIAKPVTATIVIAPGRSVIQSVPQYFQCFTNVGGSDHTYTVTVCVDQPVPGTRTAWALTSGGISGTVEANNPINTGHTFLILSESYGSTTITRNIGFYPSTIVYPPSALTAPGQFNDDDTHPYNISGTLPVTNAQFYQILNFISSSNTPAFLYNLNSNNCTTFVLNAVAQAGIDLPRTYGNWPGGTGANPGDLGEDIRTGKIPGMSLNTAPPINHQNVGQCN